MISLTPKQSDSNEEMRRRRLEELAQLCIDRVSDGGDYRIWGSILSQVGTEWLSGSGHDFRITA
jgi:hypothetical protein